LYYKGSSKRFHSRQEENMLKVEGKIPARMENMSKNDIASTCTTNGHVCIISKKSNIIVTLASK
jgi:hypothetical protein